MRKSFQGLLALVQQVFAQQDPYSGSLFVFVNRRGNYVKILMWGAPGQAWSWRKGDAMDP
jgi:transposase